MGWWGGEGGEGGGGFVGTGWGGDEEVEAVLCIV